MGPRQITGCRSSIKKTDRHHLDAVRFNGQHTRLAIRTAHCLRLLRAHPHHQRHRWTVYIGVEQTDLCTLTRERHCQVDSDGRFPHAALASGDGDDMADARDGDMFGNTATGSHLSGKLDAHPFTRDASDLFERFFTLALDLILERTGRSGQFHRKTHRIAVDDQVLDHPARYQITAEFRLLDG